jgi:hypothetical protein
MVAGCSSGAVLVLLSLFATVIFCRPVLLARRIIPAGSRGWFVARALVSILSAAVIFAAVTHFTGHGDCAPWRKDAGEINTARARRPLPPGVLVEL